MYIRVYNFAHVYNAQVYLCIHVYICNVYIGIPTHVYTCPCAYVYHQVHPCSSLCVCFSR